MPQPIIIRNLVVLVSPAEVSSSAIKDANVVAEVLPHVTVVPVNPESRLTNSSPLLGEFVALSPRSVQPVGPVMPVGLDLLRTAPMVGLPVNAEAENAGAGVPVAAWFACPLYCRIADKPVRVMPETRSTPTNPAVAVSPVQSKVTVCEELADKASATNSDNLSALVLVRYDTTRVNVVPALELTVPSTTPSVSPTNTSNRSSAAGVNAAVVKLVPSVADTRNVPRTTAAMFQRMPNTSAVDCALAGRMNCPGFSTSDTEL